MFQSMWSFEFRFRTEPCREVKTFNTKCIWTFLFTQSKLQLVINSIHWVILLTNNQQTVEIPTRSLIALGMLNQPYWLAQSQYTVRVHSTERWKSAVRGGIPQTTPHLQGPNRHRRACQCLHSLMSDSARYSWARYTHRWVILSSMPTTSHCHHHFFVGRHLPLAINETSRSLGENLRIPKSFVKMTLRAKSAHNVRSRARCALRRISRKHSRRLKQNVK